MKRELNNQSGSAVVLILSLMSVIGLGYNHVATSQSQTISHLIVEKSQRYHADAYKGLIESVLKNPQACAATFAGTPPAGPIVSILTAPATPLVAVGNVFGANRSNSSRLTLESMEWAAAGGPGSHEINITFLATVDGVNRRYNRSINMIYTLVGPGIDTCSVAENATMADACVAMGGVLVGSNCTNIQDAGTNTVNGSITASNVNVPGTGTVNSSTVAIPMTAVNLQTTSGFTATGFTAPSITSSGSVTAGSISSTTNSICAVSGCQSWINRECAPGQFMYAIAADGSISCAPW